MSTDRELLELAAKAAGFEFGTLNGKPIRREPDGQPACWNPLTDDGDALRLAVALGITVLPGCCAQIGHPYGPVYGEDALTAGATRRAIVRAAAEIGRTVK